MKTTAKILIVGAGALGLTTGYHLSLAGAKITFLVRKHRIDDLSRPQKLYCFNDHHLKTFNNIKVVTELNAQDDVVFDYVLLTLDGATCRSDQGVRTIQAIGEALAGNTTRLMINAVGIGLYEHIRQTTGLPDERILQGTMGTFAYQINQPGAPHPEGIEASLYRQADIAYLNFPDSMDFVVANKPKRAANEFMQLFNRCGVAKCKVVPAAMLTMFSNSFFTLTTASEINDWQGTESLIADSELWHLCCQSKREILGLRQHGIPGKIMAMLMSDSRQANMLRQSDKQAAPMGLTAFNRFHHGGKVQQQDIQIMENCLAAGEEQGRAMDATRELLQRWYAKTN